MVLPSSQWQYLCSILITAVSYTCAALSRVKMSAVRKGLRCASWVQSNKRFHSHSTCHSSRSGLTPRQIKRAADTFKNKETQSERSEGMKFYGLFFGACITVTYLKPFP